MREGPSPYREWLDTRGEALHHMVCESRSIDEAQVGANARRPRRSGPTEGRLDGIELYYFDTQPELKLILETGAGGELGPPLRIYPSPAS